MPAITIINPATELPCGDYVLMSSHTVETFINHMHSVQQAWAKIPFTLRAKAFIRLAELILQERDKAAELITMQMGKPITQSIGEVEKCALLCEYYAKTAEEFLQPELITTEMRKSYRCFQPLGIVFAIMPWNFPFWQVFRFAVPNLIAGNAGLLKHAPNCLGAGALIEEWFVEAGFPEGLFKSLIIDVDAVPSIIQNPYIAGITLTGSNRAGQAVAMEAGKALKKVVLELGGNDPYLILEDADLNLAAEQAVQSRLNNAGQVCIAAKRLIVVEKVREEFEALVLEKAKRYRMGDPLEANTNLGPLARADLRDNLHRQVQALTVEGATCLLGGDLPEGPGFYYPATLFTDIKPDSIAFKEELFGPVICIVPVKDEAEAIQLANATPFGLSAAVFTQDIERGEHIARDRIHAGTVAVNSLVRSDPRLPFGGIKQSGYGRELAVEGLREFMNIKTITIAK